MYKDKRIYHQLIGLLGVGNDDIFRQAINLYFIFSGRIYSNSNNSLHFRFTIIMGKIFNY